MRTDMTYSIEKYCSFGKRSAVAATLISALALGGCQSPMYSGTPDDMNYGVAPSSSPSYVGRNEKTGEGQSADEAWTAEKKYEYRGGRDPITGRANSQM
jgi:hypothetical protein